MRSLPRWRVDGCALGTVVWMLTMLGSSPLTNSTEASTRLLQSLQVAPEERFHSPMRVGVGGGIEADRGATAAARLVAVLDLRQHHARLALHVEVVDGARVEHDRGVRAAAAH